MEGWECHSTQQVVSCYTLTHEIVSVVALHNCRATAPARTARIAVIARALIK
jgi:hypothetical protein